MIKKKVVSNVKKDVNTRMKKAQKDALKELANAKRQLAKVEKQVKLTIKKNPVQSALLQQQLQLQLRQRLVLL